MSEHSSWIVVAEVPGSRRRMPILTVQVFGFRLGSTRRLLQRALAVFCLPAFGCGCEKVASTRMSFSPPPIAPQPLLDETMDAVAWCDKVVLQDNCNSHDL